jgi:hypothetical protein
MSTVTNSLQSFLTPERVETPVGIFDFPLGFPTEDTVARAYDQLDYHHALDAYINGLPAVSLYAIWKGFTSIGVNDGDVLIFSELMDSASLFLTGNSDTIYFLSFVNLADGPMVIETPPDTLGIIDDMWWEWITDFGMPGPDRGRGGTYLLLPPGYDGPLPEGGMFVCQANTNRVCILGRRFLDHDDPAPGVASIKETFRISPYVPGAFGSSIASFLQGRSPLAPATQADAPRFVEGSKQVMNTLPPTDFSYWNLLDAAIQAEPADALNPEIAGPIAAIGIVKDQPFAPDDRMTKILTEAVATGNALARAISLHPRKSEGVHYYDDTDSRWFSPLFAGGYDFMTPPPLITKDGVKPFPDAHARMLNNRSSFFYIATGITPAMCMRLTGIGSQYLVATVDSAGVALDGSKNYRLELPSDIPAERFWSAIVYDNQTRSMLDTGERYPRAGSQSYPSPAAIANADGSTSLFFGPSMPAGVDDANWIQTTPGKGWFVALRLYSPTAPFFDKTWRPGEVEPV